MERSSSKLYKSSSVSDESDANSDDKLSSNPLLKFRSASDASSLRKNIPVVVFRNRQGMAAIIVPAAPKLATTGTPPPSPTVRRANFTLPNLTAAVAALSPPNRAPARPVSQKKPASKSRRKLGPGCGMLDWIRLCRSGKDLTSTGGEKLTVKLEELARHNTREDCWTAIRGE